MSSGSLQHTSPTPTQAWVGLSPGTSSRSREPEPNNSALPPADGGDSSSEDDFTADQKGLYERNKQKESSTALKNRNMAHQHPTGAPGFTRFEQDLPEEQDGKRTWVKLETGETFVDGLRRMDPKLVTKAKGDLTAFAAHTVLDGEIGKALHHGRTKFYGPGNYAALGVGKKWIGKEKLRKNGTDIVVHQDVTLISLTENELAVVQIGKTQYPIGSGQYIIRHPSTLEGKAIDVQKLGEKHMTTVITEGTRQIVDPNTGKTITEYTQGKREINAGWTAKAGAITLVRPEPGFRYVIQQADGYRMGAEYTYARGEETFFGFMNFLQQSRTTKRFSFFSLDRQRAEMTVQLTWVMKDGIKWLTKGRAYDDPFDMLEEKAEALFRDAIGAMDHLTALKEKSDGFDSMEKEIFAKLSNSATALGAKLKSIEVRELSFPSLEAQEVQLAAKEAESRAKKLEAQRDLELRRIEDDKLAALERAKQERETAAAQARALKLKIEDERALAQVEAQSQQNLAKVRGQAEEEKARLKAEQELAAMKGETAKIIAQNEADALSIREKAKNQIYLDRARTEAEAALAMAQALQMSPGMLELKKLEIWADVEKERYRTLALFASNPNALLPEALTRDLLRMRHGEHPQEFLPSFLASAPATHTSAVPQIVLPPPDKK